MSKVKLSVLIDNQHLDDFSQVVKSIRKAGMKIEEQLKEIGVVTGSIDEKKIASLNKVKGVASVEQSRDVQIAPPDSNIQ